MKPSAPAALRHLRGELDALEHAGMLRVRGQATSAEALSFCSNDYLGLASASGSGGGPWGAGGSRLVSGDRAEHHSLEREVAGWLGAEGALVFTSGYAANVGTIAALATPGDVIVSDELNHASIIDGARLSRAKVVVVPHLDVPAVESALREHAGLRAWVLTESYFSMDADTPDLRALRATCDTHGAALVVDEAHALGVLGPDGRGLCAAAGVVPDVLVGTFGKAFGAAGAFVAGCGDLVRWLWNRSRSFVFSTGLSPAVASAARRGFLAAQTDPNLRERALEASARLRLGLRRLDLDVRGHGCIVPWVLGEAATAVRVAEALRERGVHAQPIRPPSVPARTARLRLTTSARHSREDVDRALSAIEDAWTTLRR